MRLDRERGEGICLYFGEKPGVRFVGAGLGFSGWESRPGGHWCRFMHPYVHIGRLFSDGKGRRVSVRVRIPEWLYNRLRGPA